MLRDAGLCAVLGFEPQAAAYERLLSSARETETYLPHAVGAGGEERLHICRGEGFTSLLPPNPAFIDFMGRWPSRMRVTEVQPIETRRLDDIDEIPEFDLLKIDVQGAELSVFRNGRSKLSGAISVISEVAMVPLYEGQPLLDAQMSELSSQGFGFHKFMFLRSLSVHKDATSRLRPRRAANQAVDGDAVFIRGLFALQDYSDEQLKHLAILADSVFESFDLVMVVLDSLVVRGVLSPSEIDGYVALLPEGLVR